jgi:hypothetical protein
MNSNSSPGGANHLHTFAISAACLALVLGFLFARSFGDSEVLFSNDGPLGLISAQAEDAWKHFTGIWLPLNWIGTQGPASLPTLTQVLFLLLGPVGFAKFYVPIAALTLGLAATLLSWRLRFSPAACVLVGIAAALNTDFFSHACWGLASITLAIAFALLALAALSGPLTARHLVLGGFATGVSVMEGFDSGAIISLFIAAFVIFKSVLPSASRLQGLGRGILRTVVVAMAAAFMATAALTTLISTQVQGVAGMGQDTETRQLRWNQATQWSLPKRETLRVVVPGLFGYRMDTPDGGWYWGGVGRDPLWDDYLSTRQPNPASAPTGALLRHSGAGFYAGVLVVLVAFWAVAHSFRRQRGPFDELERKYIWFWSGAALISLLLAFGRHAPFYQFVYALPYFSTIRNPIKFLHPFEISTLILFGYGLQGLWRSYLTTAPAPSHSALARLRLWWATCPPADRRWTLGSGTALAVALVSWLTYASSQSELSAYLQKVGFNDPEMAQAIARFSVAEAGWALLFLTLASGLITLIMSGNFSGTRARWAGLILGALLVTDLARANAPWIVYYDYLEKYASNPVIDLLRDQPHQQRVAARLMPMARSHLVNDQGRLFSELHGEWLEHLFQYYKIQSLDVIQMPRAPELDTNYMQTFQPATNNDFKKIGRLWELTNTRYILGMAGFLDFLNQQFDPSLQRFRLRSTFNILPKPGNTEVTRLAQLTTRIESNATYAIFEFQGALPRAALYPQWESVSDDQAALQRLADTAFDPHTHLLVHADLSPAATTSVSTPGTVSIESYEPKRIRLRARTDTPAVLLLNDRYHPDWKVTVDRAPVPLLRCNHIMRGVLLESGEHVVEFEFKPAALGLYISLTAVATGLILLTIHSWPTTRFRAAAGSSPSTSISRPRGKPDGTPGS